MTIDDLTPDQTRRLNIKVAAMRNYIEKLRPRFFEGKEVETFERIDGALRQMQSIGELLEAFFRK